MADLAGAAAAALATGGRFLAILGRDAGGLTALRDAATAAITAPGPGTRLGIAAGVMAGGHRPVVVLDAAVPPAPQAPDILAVTQDAGVAAEAVRVGWTVLQPWAEADVAPLLAGAPLPALAFLASHDDVPPPDMPAARPVREWERGDLATLASSGPGVSAMLELGNRLRARGVDVGMLEIAALGRPELEPLAGGRAVLVAGRGSAAAWRRGDWPAGRVDAVTIEGEVDADLVGAVMALVPAI